MRLSFPELPELNYKRLSQRIRVLSETWMQNEMYCPVCGNNNLVKFPNNSRMADFFCSGCNEIYELKSKGSPIGKSILDGAYYTALERINSNTNPNLFVLRYDRNRNIIEDLLLIPKFFFTSDVLKMRNALSSSARRAGSIGSVILYGNIPEHGKIAVIKSHTELNKNIVLKNYSRSAKLRIENINLRGWLMDILNCVDKINHEVFLLKDLYGFADELSEKHPDNNNVTAKIRQQLQFLRDKGFIEFLGRGKYKKIFRG